LRLLLLPFDVLNVRMVVGVRDTLCR
jgi:hypothetical protein